MGKRSNTQETLVLALELLRRIPRNRKVSASELHQQLKDVGLDRELRTIQRQLEVLSEHFDIERDILNRPYGYKWKEKARGMSLPMLSAQESLLLSLAEEHLRNLLPSKIMKSMEGFFLQAKYNLGKPDSAKLEKEWLKKVRVVSETQPLLAPEIHPKVMEEVSSALYANKWLKIDYENAQKYQHQAEVMPLGLAQQGPRLYLVCRFKDYDDDRTIALHRIKTAEASTMGFDRPKSFDLKKYDDDGRFGFGDGEKISLSFRISKPYGAHLLETPLSKDQEVKELKNVYEITATVIDADRLDWWLAGFGKEVTQVKKKKLS